MKYDNRPKIVEEFLSELLKRNAITINCLIDKTLINYLYTCNIDIDYINPVGRRDNMPA
jgi:hypothetical protein